MPSTYLSKHKGLQTSSELLRGRGRSFLFGNTCFVFSEPFSTLGCAFRLLPKSSISDPHACGGNRPFQIFSSPAVAAQNLTNQISQPVRRFPFWWNIMSSSSAFLRGSGLAACPMTKDNSSSKLILNSTMRVNLCSCSNGLNFSWKACGSLRNQKPWGSNMAYKCFWSNTHGMNWRYNSSVEPQSQDLLVSCSAPYSTGAAPDLSFDATVQEEQIQNPVVSSEQKNQDHEFLKLLSGSCYLPHPDKEDTGGEDAHFICSNEQAVGVADGVGGWADLGVDSGQYARELMSNSANAIREEPKGSIDPLRVLEKAYSITTARGSSTACIIALTSQGIHALNLGDSGFIVVRDGSTLFRSPVQQHDFNFTYQLESGNGSDLPSSAQVFNFPVASGDIVIAGTDGLFDNLYNNEITAIVIQATRASLGPQVTAQKIAALARQRAQDRNRQTPFSAAAQDAGYRYYGGKLDDITVVVSYITASDV
ncbi:probable protein phosphatase 2C 55 [Zingiber officinale]|uniref:Protein phosphatase n=1 Tax=Zingiber officinale TaxID=94328 RepID=A0A8J5FMY9_ZINOF|nr:probable protein phosphatase 2C 55 [Zingiber officinale]XP_042418283.1 probable protein phosphatase 2C 55 [Zingiber officinale]XP_042418284.1 probable protein phosphatase 2C 55 [Zingiber officinale]XP_042418285.1 probable protein phosphatase 2C 55 [Zingiber officinale]KAG6490783.1 hypothetical protein ZIOFF_052096 [Zingiber officinale]